MSGRKELQETLELVAAMRQTMLRIYQCRLNNGNGTICRSCWTEAYAYTIGRSAPTAAAEGARE